MGDEFADVRYPLPPPGQKDEFALPEPDPDSVECICGAEAFEVVPPANILPPPQAPGGGNGVPNPLPNPRPVGAPGGAPNPLPVPAKR